MDYKGNAAGNKNAAGWERNANKHFAQLLEAHPEYFSPKNVEAISNNINPTIDAQFAYYFPQYGDYIDDTLIHHHIGGGGQAAAVPESLHMGYGGIHNIENANGIRGNDYLTNIGKTFTGHK